jgi:hypothetical protein
MRPPLRQEFARNAALWNARAAAKERPAPPRPGKGRSRRRQRSYEAAAKVGSLPAREEWPESFRAEIWAAALHQRCVFRMTSHLFSEVIECPNEKKLTIRMHEPCRSNGQQKHHRDPTSDKPSRKRVETRRGSGLRSISCRMGHGHTVTTKCAVCRLISRNELNVHLLEVRRTPKIIGAHRQSSIMANLLLPSCLVLLI